MVQRKYVKCPICEKLYQIKIQLDQNFRFFDWQISFECLECGENLEYTFGKNGFRPKECNFTPDPTNSPITTIGFSSSLPITDELYMKDLDYSKSLINFSPYMSITQSGYFLIEEVHQFDIFLSRMQNYLLPYKEALKALFPNFKKSNVSAFSKKMALLFKISNYKTLSSTKEMYDVYFKLIEKTYRNLVTPYYESHSYMQFIKPLENYINEAMDTEIKAIKEKLDESGKISIWYKNEALPYIADMVSNVHKFIPAMIYSSAGISDVTQKGNLKIITISCKDATGIYSKGFETYTHALKIVVGLNNIVENGSIDIFTNPKVGDVDTITKFASKSGGKMLEHLENYSTVYDYLDEAMNNKIRNAASHGEGGIEYNPLTQEVKCFYDDSNKSKHYDTTLIAICRMCFVQLLHIMEATLLARKIIEKAK